MNHLFAKLLLFLALSSPLHASHICNTDLLFSYGVQNPQYLNQSSLFCQTGATETCCTNNDQSWILERWNEKERLVIQPFYELTVWLFKTIFQFYEDVILSAKYAYINPQTQPACRQAAEFLILNYIDREEIVKFVEDLSKTNDFFAEIRRGFYCSLCTLKNQKYFNTDLKKITMSYDFCQDLVENVLETVALRINKVMPVLANMNAMLNCQLPDQPDDQAIFSISADKFYAVNQCYDAYARFKNPQAAFSACQKFCADFSLVQPSESFEGIIKPLATLKQKLLDTKIVPTDPLWDDVDYKQHYNFAALRDQFFNADLTFQDLGKFETIFDQYGLDPVSDSESSLFDYSEESGMENLEMKAGVLGWIAAIGLALLFK